MKLLVFEFICGGGFAGSALPPTLAAEGRLMLQALLDDLKPLPDLQLLLPLDSRCTDLDLPGNAKVFSVVAADDYLTLLATLIDQCDAVWPIAPETGGVLTAIAAMVESRGKYLLLSSSESVEICGHKLKTYQLLVRNSLPAIETYPLEDFSVDSAGQYVIKPADGVGCEGNIIVDNHGEYEQALTSIVNSDAYVIQPLVAGPPISLSCLFKRGKAWLLCCNQQQITIASRRFQLHGCLVNTDNPLRGFYQNLIEQMAQSMPELWGYVGIDLIESQVDGPLILEINPRLTTSYAGIRQATGINVAEQVLQMLTDNANPVATCRQPVEIVIY